MTAAAVEGSPCGIWLQLDEVTSLESHVREFVVASVTVMRYEVWRVPRRGSGSAEELQELPLVDRMMTLMHINKAEPRGGLADPGHLGEQAINP